MPFLQHRRAPPPARRRASRSAPASGDCPPRAAPASASPISMPAFSTAATCSSRVRDRRLQLLDPGAHGGGGLVPVVALAVAGGAERLLVGAEHRVGRLDDVVVAVALHAAAVEDLAVRAQRELRGEHACGRCRRRWSTAPTPGGAAPWLPWQSLQVGADRSLRSDHRRVSARCFSYFARWSVGSGAPSARVALHVLGVGVARRARGGDVQRIHRRLRVAHQPHAVRAVAADAGGHLGVALGQLLAVHAAWRTRWPGRRAASARTCASARRRCGSARRRR